MKENQRRKGLFIVRRTCLVSILVESKLVMRNEASVRWQGNLSQGSTESHPTVEDDFEP
jgi:hypothetical protein